MNRDHLPALKDIILWQTMDKTANALPIIQGNNGAAGSTLESEIDKALSMLRRWDDLLYWKLVRAFFKFDLIFACLSASFVQFFDIGLRLKLLKSPFPSRGNEAKSTDRTHEQKESFSAETLLLHPDWTIQRFRLQNGSAWFGISVGKPLQAFHISTRGTTTQNAVSNAFNVHSLSLVAFGSVWINREMLSWHKLTMLEWALQPESQVSGCFRILEWQHVLAKHSKVWICHVAELVDLSYAMTHILPFIWSHSIIAYKCMIMHSCENSSSFVSKITSGDLARNPITLVESSVWMSPVNFCGPNLTKLKHSAWSVEVPPWLPELLECGSANAFVFMTMKLWWRQGPSLWVQSEDGRIWDQNYPKLFGLYDLGAPLPQYEWNDTRFMLSQGLILTISFHWDTPKEPALWQKVAIGWPL